MRLTQHPPIRVSPLTLTPPSARPFVFYYNFCGGVQSRGSGDVRCGPTDAACQQDGDLFYSLGKLSTAKWEEDYPNGASVTYTGGSSRFEPEARSVRVNLICTKGDQVLGPVTNPSDGALYIMNITTRAA